MLLMVADGIGIPALDDFNIVQNPAGGTFGYKFSPTMEGLLGVAALVTKRPVYLRIQHVPTDNLYWKKITFLYES